MRLFHKRATPIGHRTLAKRFAYAALLIGSASALQTTPEIDRQIPTLLENYRALHQHPELSHHETWTATYLGDALRIRRICRLCYL